MRANRLIVCLVVGLACLRARAVGPTGEIMRLHGHTDAVLAAVISQDGTRIVTGSNDRTAIVWDAQTGKALQRLEGHATGVTSVGISADGGRVVTGSIDHSARVWDAKTGELLAILRGAHRQHVHGVAISPDGKRVVTASCDRSVVLWDVATERPVQQYRHAGEAHAVAFSPDGKTFLSGCKPSGNQNAVEKNLRLYDAATGKVLDEFEIKGVDEVAYVEGGKRALVLGQWELSSLDVEGRKLTHLTVRGMPIHTLGASADGKQILSCGPFDARVVYLEDKTRRGSQFRGPMGEVMRVTRISPDGTWGLIGGGGKNDPWGWSRSEYEPGKDCDVRIVSLKEDFDPAVYRPGDPRLAETVAGIVGSADGGRLLVYYADGSLVWWDGESGLELGRQKWEWSAIAGSMSPGGDRTVAAGNAGRVTVFDGTKEVGRAEDASDVQVLALAPGPDAGSVFAGGWRRAQPKPGGPGAMEIEVHQYGVKDGSEIRKLQGPAGAVSALATSPDGRTVVSLCSNQYGGETAALAWDLASGRELWRWKPAAEPKKCLIRPLMIDPAGRTAAFAFQTKVVLLDMATGKLLLDLPGDTSDVKVLAFDPDGKRIWAVAGWFVRSWDLKTGAKLTDLRVPIRTDYVAFRFAEGRHLLIEAFGKRLIEHELER